VRHYPMSDGRIGYTTHNQLLQRILHWWRTSYNLRMRSCLLC